MLNVSELLLRALNVEKVVFVGNDENDLANLYVKYHPIKDEVYVVKAQCCDIFKNSPWDMLERTGWEAVIVDDNSNSLDIARLAHQLDKLGLELYKDSEGYLWFRYPMNYRYN